MELARPPPDRNECAAGGIGLAHARHHLLLEVGEEFVHLALHLLHAGAHVEDDGDAADVHAQVARQRQNDLQSLQVIIGVEAGVALGARRLQQALALVQAQGLRMNAVHLGHG